MLADSGFDISDLVGMTQARLHIPAFTKGKSQLTAIENGEIPTIAYTMYVKIHVECMGDWKS